MQTRFAILQEPGPAPADLAPTDQNPEPKVKPEKPSEPEKGISYNQILNMIDDFGYNLANDKNATTEEKLEAWVDLLKSVLPLIPEEQQHFKAQVKESIENPTEWDFMPKPQRS